MSFKFPEKILVQLITDERHYYGKVPAALLCDMDIASRISPYSYLGVGDKPWNQRGYAFLEEDCDLPLFVKACEFWKIEVDEDFKTLQEDFETNCECPEEWFEEQDEEGDPMMCCFDTENLDWLGIEGENFVSIDTWKELNAFLAKEEDDDELPDNSDSSD